MSDVFNIMNEIENLKSEINSLKSETKYLRKKALITPLIVLYNHVRDENIKNKSNKFSLSITTLKNQSKTFKIEQLISTNEEIEFFPVGGKKWQHHCDISEIKEITFSNNSDRKNDYFTNKF